MKHIKIITTGGTIASTKNKNSDGVVAGIKGNNLIATIKDRLPNIRLTVDDFCTLDSAAFTLPLAFSLAKQINETLQQADCDGVVVTHGTDTMEESAFLSDLIVQSNKPVIFTGAQRNASESDSDGPRNIVEALIAAQSDETQNLGTLIAFEHDLHAAREVSKTHTYRVDSFRSSSFGKIGSIEFGKVSIWRKPLMRRPIATTRIEDNIGFMKLAMGVSPDYLTFSASQGVKGFVLEAFGLGNAPDGFAAAIKVLTDKKIPVIISSRCIEGRTMPIYGGDSGGVSLAKAGAIFSGSLSGVKSRIALACLIGAGATYATIQHYFDAQ